ncbi:MAG: hypothetical protein JNL64_11305 [Blastocatellia bacterium]|nr:hypothetical protein [Blastocatellia bacterium]
MNIERELLAEHSKTQTAKVVDYVGDDPAKFAELMRLFVGPNYRISQRAAWAVSNCIEHHPELVKPHYGTLFKQLEREDAHVAVKRNVVRLLQFVEIPKRYEGRVFDACYNLFADVTEPIAVRCFSLTVAVNIAKDSPELMAELKSVAENHPEKMSAGFRSRVKRHFGI